MSELQLLRKELEHLSEVSRLVRERIKRLEPKPNDRRGRYGQNVAYLEAQMEDAIAQIEYHTGERNTPENSSKYRSIIQNAMSKTGRTLEEVTAATKQEVRMFKGTPGGGIDVLPEMLQAAATEARLKGTSLEESMTSLIGLSHMTKEYSSDQIKKLAPAFAFLSASNPSSLGTMEKAASYAVPILQSGMEIDPMQTLLLGTALTRAGATNSKSGTWLRNMMLNSMPGTSMMSKIAFEKHEEALKALGLVDENNKPTWFTDNKPDPFKMLSIASEHAAAIPLDKRAAYEKQLFGSQGFGGFALLADPAVREQVQALNTEMNSDAFKNRYANFQQDYNANSPLQAGRVLDADTQNALMDLGKTILPSLVHGIHDLDDGIHTSEAQFKAFADVIAPVVGGFHSLSGALNGLLGAVQGAGEGLRNKLGIPLPTTPKGLEDHFNPGGNPPLGKQSSNTQPVHIKTAVYLDGKQIGESVSATLASISTFPRQAAFADSYNDWAAPDFAFTAA
jgi:hypothetical protein